MQRSQEASRANGKPDRRETGREPGPADTREEGGKGRRRIKQTFSITEEASRLLAVHAAYLEVDRCEIVDRLIRQNLTRFSVVDRGELA